MKRNIRTIIICCLFANLSFGQEPFGVSPPVHKTLEAATNFMNLSNYDSAQFVISLELAQIENPVGETDLYYLHSYEAEIMYYNALFEQGLNSSMRALDVAIDLKDDTLIGNSENLIGLFMMNLERYDEALVHLKKAAQLIAIHQKNDYLAYQYHALANVGECFFKMNLPDSAIFYSNASISEAQSRGRNRGVALAYWNIAESMLLKNSPDEAREYSIRGLALTNDSPHRDVVQNLCATLMKVYEQKLDNDSVYFWMEKGLIENQNPLNTDLSRILFLQEATDICVTLKNIEKGTSILSELNKLSRDISNKQQAQRVAILKDYYEKNQKLIVAKGLDNAQKQQLQLRNTILVILSLLAFLLVAFIFIFIQSSKRKQRISELQHKEEMRISEKELEIKALQEKMEAVSLERNRIASDLHDDIGAALSSIRIYSGAAQKQFSSNPEESSHLIQRINESSSAMMDRMGDIVWSINPKNDNAESLILRMKSIASEALGMLDMKIEYNISDDMEKYHPSMEARKNIYLIFKEAINNIAKYSEAKKVDVTMHIEGAILNLHIKDDGKGFHTQQAQSGNGLVNMNNRAKALGGTLHISSHVGRGTQLHFTVGITNISDEVVVKS